MVDRAMIALCVILIAIGIWACLMACINKKWPDQ